MLKEELQKKLNDIKEQLIEILLDESIVGFTNSKFDEDVRKSAKFIKDAIKEID